MKTKAHKKLNYTLPQALCAQIINVQQMTKNIKSRKMQKSRFRAGSVIVLPSENPDLILSGNKLRLNL